MYRLTTDFLRPEKAKMLERQYALFCGSKDSALAVGEAADAWIVPPVAEESWSCGVVDRHGDVYSVCPLSGDIPSPDDLAAAASAAGGLVPQRRRVLFAGYLNAHWGHFLVDSLSRLWAVYAGVECDEIVFCCHERVLPRIHANIYKALELSGLKDKIRIATSPERYSTVLVPELAVYPRSHFNTRSLPVYESIASAAQAQAPGSRDWPAKIYLSRSRFKKSLVNEPGAEWLDVFFRRNGFEIIYPEATGLVELINYIRNADTVAMLSGTLPHNMLFARSGQRLWVIEKTAELNNYQQGIDIIKELDVVCVDACAMLWTVNAGLGPFVIYPNHIFLRFAEAEGLEPPQAFTPGKTRRILRRFVSVYRRHYAYQWVMAEWVEPEVGVLREAYRDTMADFGDYMTGRKRFRYCDMMNPRLIAKAAYHAIRRLRKSIFGK